ncbi:hypothetical protein NX023_00280 [Cytobacillus firmus]|nr:hypothetical protein [Cytobacillus firmus]
MFVLTTNVNPKPEPGAGEIGFCELEKPSSRREVQSYLGIMLKWILQEYQGYLKRTGEPNC